MPLYAPRRCCSCCARTRCIRGRRLLDVRRQSRALLTGIISIFVVGYLVLAFELFYHGLRFLAKFPGLGAALTERLLYTLFAFLFVLLLLSNLVISYTNLFRNRETAFLLSLPVSTQTIFRWKFIESVILASWAFMFLIAPLLLAFGLVRDVPWDFYVLTAVLIGMFIILPGVFGAAAAIAIGAAPGPEKFPVACSLRSPSCCWPSSRSGGRPRRWTMTSWTAARSRRSTSCWPRRTSPCFRCCRATGSRHPSCNGRKASRAARSFLAAVLLSHTLFFGYIASHDVWKPFLRHRLRRAKPGGRRIQIKLFFRGLKKIRTFPVSGKALFAKLFWLSPDTRALAVKDLRMFWRDTTQWGQSVMFFGLLGAYIINLRNFTHQLTSPFWIHAVAFLNLGACAFNLASVTTRFVFPQFSLEGRRL